MTEEKVEIIENWDEAFSGGTYVQLVSDEQKKLTIKNWQLIKVDKFGKEGVELQSDCIAEDGETVEKKFTTTSNRLKKKLRPILEGKNALTDEVTLTIMKVGDKFDTQFSNAFEDFEWEIVSKRSPSSVNAIFLGGSNPLALSS